MVSPKASHEEFIEKRQDDGRQVLTLKGDWTIYHTVPIENAIRSAGKKFNNCAIDATQLEKLDTAGAWLIRKYFSKSCNLRLTSRQKELLEFIPDAKKNPEKERTSSFREFFEQVGRLYEAACKFSYDIVSFLGLIFVRFLANFLRPRHFRIPSIVRHIDETGIRALPIVGLLAFGTSMVVSYQASTQLKKFGADIFAVDLTIISLLREMSVLITAIMMAGRSGSAFAAEIGVMKLRGEVDALRTMGMDPVETLVLPRLLALLLTVPLLTFMADIIGIAGGGLMAADQLHISLIQYIDRVQHIATPTMFFVGLVKAPVFAILIALVCTYQGMNVSGSAENVGKVTTIAVVQSIFLVIMTDALFSIIFARMDI
jgi:phospholipid/cholesterol/gamma-HCH transport system permease protein